MKLNSVQQRAIERAPKATPAQQKYIDGLLIDCSLSNIKARNTWLTEELQRDIKFLDEITKNEASWVIDRLNQMKAGIKLRKLKPVSGDDMETEDEI